MEVVLNTLYVVSLLVMLVGAGVLVLDVIFSFLSDKCTEPTVAEYVVNKKTGLLAASKDSGFFVLSQPEFRYVYKNKKYRGRSANFFMKVFVPKGANLIPFEQGNKYMIYVNPDEPKKFVTDGEQFFNPFRVIGLVFVVAGVLLWMAITYLV